MESSFRSLLTDTAFIAITAMIISTALPALTAPIIPSMPLTFESFVTGASASSYCTLLFLFCIPVPSRFSAESLLVFPVFVASFPFSDISVPDASDCSNAPDADVFGCSGVPEAGAVSYTHLDVYKRQAQSSRKIFLPPT